MDRRLLVDTGKVVVFEDDAAKWIVMCVVGAGWRRVCWMRRRRGRVYGSREERVETRSCKGTGSVGVRTIVRMAAISGQECGKLASGVYITTIEYGMRWIDIFED